MELKIGKYKLLIQWGEAETASTHSSTAQDIIFPDREIVIGEGLEEQILWDDLSRVKKEEPIATDEPIVADEPIQRFMEDCTDIIREFDRYKQYSKIEEVHSILELINDRLFEVLERSGGKLIIDDTAFNILRHEPVPAEIVEDGVPILETIRPGVEIKNKVLIRAQVRVK